MNTVSIIVGGESINALGITVVESMMVMYQYVTFSVPGRLQARDIQVNFGKKEKYKVISESFNGFNYTYVAIHEKAQKLLESTFKEFTGNADAKGLCSKIGIDAVDFPATNNTFWMIPALKLAGVIKYLGNYTSVSNGGGPRVFVNLKGELEMIDIKSSFEKSKAIGIKAEVKDDQTQTDWSLEYAGAFDVVIGTLNKVESKETTLTKGYSKSTLWINDTTGKAKDLQVQAASNQFWKRYYASRRVKVDLKDADSDIDLGSVVTINGTSDKFVVGERVTLFDATGIVHSIGLTLYSNVKDN